MSPAPAVGPVSTGSPGGFGDLVTGRPKLAVIGLGGISRSVHLPLLRRNADTVELVAVVDASPARARATADAHGATVAAFDSVDSLVAAVSAGELALDGAILATTGSHAPDVARLVAAGVRVLAEKPLALTLGEISELHALATRLGIDLDDRVRVGYMKEHDPASVRAKELLAGVQLRAVGVEVLHPADGAQLAFANLPPAPTDIPAEALARFAADTRARLRAALGDAADPLPKLYSNVVLGSIVHDIGLLRYLVGGIGTVDRALHHGPGFPGSLSLGGALREQPTVPWSIDWHFIAHYPEYRETVTFHHSEGTIELVFAVPYVLNVPTVLTVVSNAEPLGSTRSESRWMQQEAFENELRAFTSLLASRPAPGPSVMDAADDIAVGQLMIRTLATGLGSPLKSGAEAAAEAPEHRTPTPGVSPA